MRFVSPKFRAPVSAQTRDVLKSMSQYIAFAAVDCEHTTVSLRISVAFRHIVIGNTLGLVISACISQHAWESCDYSVCAQVPDSTHLCFSYISRTISALKAFAKFIYFLRVAGLLCIVALLCIEFCVLATTSAKRLLC